MAKILYYNWVQFDNKKNTGGGVNVYLKNLMNKLAQQDEHDIYFLSSGWKYNPLKQGPYIRKTQNIHQPKIKSFEIINSPIMAPAFVIFNSLTRYLNDDITEKLFIEFIKENGPFDVIHINNIEGISINVLKIKEHFPNTKIILSIHNYQPICPLNQYFQNHNNCICNDYKEGEECLKCLISSIDKKEYVRRYRNYLFDLINIEKFPFLKVPLKAYSKLFMYKNKQYLDFNKGADSSVYKKYREYNVSMINKYADLVLAVSDRVGEILIENGINPNIIKTSYIGTKIAENQVKGNNSNKQTNPFTIAYIGYERIDKGYFFLLDALEKLDKNIAKQMNVLLAVRNINKKFAQNKLKNFNKVIIYNGYNHKELPKIMAQVNLGIVPVIWEDNLPQVAIEMVACGVPILCSSFGGASELCKSELFKYKGGDQQDFLEHLIKFINSPSTLNDYWNNHIGLTTMDKHIEELFKFYES